MKARWFRFKEGDGEWRGLAIASTVRELFWVIDQFGDPYSCEVSKTYRAGMCALKTEDRGVEYSDEELQWVKPKWPRSVYGK
jgi:hypothetical protein